jgi:hypothetical protein
MGRIGRWVLSGVLAVLAGCGWAGRPYAKDPLVRDGRGVAGDPVKVATARQDPPPEPAAPRPPAAPDPSTFAGFNE